MKLTFKGRGWHLKVVLHAMRKLALLSCHRKFSWKCVRITWFLRNWLRYWLRWCFSFICFLWLIVFRNGLTYVRNTRKIILSFHFEWVPHDISSDLINFHFQEKLKLSKVKKVWFLPDNKNCMSYVFLTKKLQINWTLYW